MKTRLEGNTGCYSFWIITIFLVVLGFNDLKVALNHDLKEAGDHPLLCLEKIDEFIDVVLFVANH